MYFDRLQLKKSCSSTKQMTYSLSFLLKFSRLRLEFNFKQLWKIKCQLDPKTTGDMGEVRGMAGRYGKVIFKSLQPPAFTNIAYVGFLKPGMCEAFSQRGGAYIPVWNTLYLSLSFSSPGDPWRWSPKDVLEGRFQPGCVEDRCQDCQNLGCDISGDVYKCRCCVRCWINTQGGTQSMDLHGVTIDQSFGWDVFWW